jgi:prephenate dehydrogenase/chorismate mutase
VDLQEIREGIDDIDRQILSLLHERMELALRTARLKAGVRDRSREADVLEEAERYARSNKLLVSDGFVRGLFDDIIRESRRIQESDRPLAGLPGEHGSRAEPAAPDVPVPGILQRGGRSMKIAVVGVGKMGRWLVRELALKHDVCAYDRDPARTADLGRVPVAAGIEGITAFKPDMLVNAVNLKGTIAAFEELVPHLDRACILADVASVKGPIPGFYQQAGFRFVSVHPMFGPTFANVARLEDENAIIIKESDREGASLFFDLFRRRQMTVHEYSFEQHDRLIAYSLTLPFASTMVFAACMETAAVPGSTFKKHLEIAQGLLAEDDELLAEIIFNPHSVAQLDHVTARLEFLKHIIRARDGEEAAAFFERLRSNLRISSRPGLS